MSNTIKARYDNGVTNYKQDGTAVAVCIEDFYQGRPARVYEEEAPTLRSDRQGLKVGVNVTKPDVVIPVISPEVSTKTQNGRRMKENGDDSFALTARDRHGVAVKVAEATQKGYAEEHPSGYVQIDEDTTVWAVWCEKYQCYIAIRKLTPKECFRLQGWTDDYFDKAQFVNSDSQLYKQAGNGITVNVAYVIGRAISEVRGL